MKSIELFSGTGGLAIGLFLSGFQHLGLYEIDDDCCRNLSLNISSFTKAKAGPKVIETDVQKIDFSVFKDKLDLLAGGPPCQPFSLGGKGNGNHDKRNMFPQAARALAESLPKSFLFENVKGLLRPSFRDYFEYIVLTLTYPLEKRFDAESWQAHKKRLLGIDVTKYDKPFYRVVYHLFNVADFGVPQERFRVIIVGFRNDLKKEWIPPEPDYSKSQLLYDQWISGTYWERNNCAPKAACPLSDKQLSSIKRAIESQKKHKKPWLTVREAFIGLPSPSELSDSRFPNNEIRNGAKSYPGHTGSSLDWPSKTIKAGNHGVPGGENMVILDNGEQRYYSVRESARIQTFPDTFFFSSSWTESMRQIGNAVPVLFAEKIGNSIKKQLEDKK